MDTSETSQNSNNPLASGNAASESEPHRAEGMRSLELLFDIPLTISAELGRCKISIGQLLEMGQGAVIELDKLAGELLDIRVNGHLIARGEAVVVNNKFGVRLKEVSSTDERLKQLNPSGSK
jgi:flagellar motor switch protein FliN/FliY